MIEAMVNLGAGLGVVARYLFNLVVAVLWAAWLVVGALGGIDRYRVARTLRRAPRRHETPPIPSPETASARAATGQVGQAGATGATIDTPVETPDVAPDVVEALVGLKAPKNAARMAVEQARAAGHVEFEPTFRYAMGVLGY